jgi:hypothetical protein
MADVYAVFGTLLAMGIVFPGLLTTWWLLFPVRVERIRARLAITPWGCLGMGTLGALAFGFPIALLLGLPFGPAKFVGTILLFSGLAFASLGATGLAAEMGDRLARQSGAKFTPAGAMVGGALALELAAAFPLIGWFLVIPLVTVAGLGAACFGLLRWSPRPSRQPSGGAAISRA